MKIHHLRNATFVIESGPHHILIDPMLSEKGELAPFARFRHKPQNNPTVPLPDNAPEILHKITHCLITHSQTFGIRTLQHTDHLDAPGESFLKKNNIPVVCRRQDADYLKKYGINVETKLDYWQPARLLGVVSTAFPAQHGHGWVHYMMANGAGLHLQFPGEPSIYITGDTIYSDDVARALTELKPDITVVPAGSASLDVGGPILMPLDEILKFIQDAPGKVIANHLEALNHCPTTRTQLKQELEKRDLLTKTFIPLDGETITMEIG